MAERAHDFQLGARLASPGDHGRLGRIPRQRERAARYRLPHRDIFLHNDPEQHHARDYDGGVQRIPWRRCAIQMVENQGLQLLPEYENTWIVLVV